MVTDFEKHLEKMRRVWPSTVCARNKIAQFTGGAYSGTYLANCDSQRIGPKERFLMGQRMVYPVDSLIEWLVARSGSDARKVVRKD